MRIRVLLPAPLARDQAEDLAGADVKLAERSACTPPNRLLSPSTASRASAAAHGRDRGRGLDGTPVDGPSVT